MYISWTRAEKLKKLLASDGLRQTSPSFLFTLHSFGSRSKHYNRRNIHLKSESITGQPASKLVVLRKLPGSSRTVALVLRTVVFAKTILEHYSQRMFTKTVRILRSDLSLIRQVFVKCFPRRSTSQVLSCEVAWRSDWNWPHCASDWLVSSWRHGTVVGHWFRSDSLTYGKWKKKGRHCLRIRLKFLLSMQSAANTVGPIWSQVQ